MDFFQTVMGKQFFQGTLPQIARSLDSIAKSLEKVQAPEPVKADPEYAYLVVKETQQSSYTEPRYFTEASPYSKVMGIFKTPEEAEECMKKLPEWHEGRTEGAPRLDSYAESLMRSPKGNDIDYEDEQELYYDYQIIKVKYNHVYDGEYPALVKSTNFISGGKE